MVLGKAAVRRSHEATDREIEPRGTELPLIITIGVKFSDRIGGARMLQHMGRGVIDSGNAAAAFFIG